MNRNQVWKNLESSVQTQVKVFQDWCHKMLYKKDQSVFKEFVKCLEIFRKFAKRFKSFTKKFRRFNLKDLTKF